MRRDRLRNLAVVVCAAGIICGSAFAQPEGSTAEPSGTVDTPVRPDPPAQRGGGSSRVPVDYKGNNFYPISIGDSLAHVVVGNVAFHHNGAIVVCDSAVRYNDYLFEGFGNVIIKKDSAYIYGDRIDYDGTMNTARVYAPIVKMIDGDATMYSYDLAFNTQTSIATYSQGGTLTQKDNLIESTRAQYHTETRTVYFADRVTMRNDSYLLESDSLSYNFDTEVSLFHKNTSIWDNDGDFLSSDHGSYDRTADRYDFFDSSYILTPTRQLWADSMIYLKTDSIAYLFDNIQIFDEEQNTLAFGDRGIYLGGPGDAILTRKPSILTIEEKASGEVDTAYTSADSIFLYTITLRPAALQDSLAVDSTAIMDVPDGLYDRIEQLRDEIAVGTEEVADTSVSIPPESVIDTAAIVEVIPNDLLAADAHATNTASLDSVAVPGPEKSWRQRKREFRAIRRLVRLGVPGYDLSMITRGGGVKDSLAADSLAIGADSLLPDGEPAFEEGSDSTEIYETVIPVDSVQRIIKAYYNVKVFRSDIQAVCDSLISFSKDSTLHMYKSLLIEDGILPVLWNEDNQIFSDQMHFFSKNQELEHAEFEGLPMMVERLSDSSYNQLAGTIMYAWFRNNDIEKLQVDGNGETYYYQAEEGLPPTEFLAITAAQIIFTFDTAGIYSIAYYTDVVYNMFPADKIPETQATRLRNFHWYGDLRPRTKEDVFNRTIRPSRREESELLERPVFTITEEINNRKLQYTEEGIWRERNDEPDITPDFFYDRYGRER